MPAAAIPSRHTVLVVDDEPDVVKSVKDLLRLDHRVIGATSAAEAMRVMQSEEIHVVMTDQRMPEMTGVQFLSRVRNQHPDAIRLLFTGYADIKAVIDAINQGNVYRYITKPWEPDELHAMIREACERYDLIVERQQLTQMLQQQNRELERANAELMRANELKHAFIQVASHELRTPLTILQGLAKLAGAQPDLPDSTRELVARIERASRRIQHLVDQILAMLVAGKFERPLELAEHDVGAVLRDAADDVRPFAELRKQVLEVDVPQDLGTAWIEPGKMRDSVNHLLLNAVKFTPDAGTVRLAAARERGGAGDSDGSGDTVVIRVIDTGVGLDKAHVERVFEPFFTGFDVSRHSSGTYEHGRKGLGLGLALVKAFVEMHGGRVSAASEPGKGSTFTIRLPARPPERTESSSGTANMAAAVTMRPQPLESSQPATRG